MQQGKVDEAIAELQGIETRDPSAKGLAFEIGTAYYKKSDFSKAIEYLKKATSADPANNEAAQLLGLSYYLNGHPVEAIPLLERVQAWYPRANVDAAYILGVCYIQTKNYDQARKSFGKMFDVPGESAAAYLFTARMLLRQEYDPIAEEYAQKAAALDPKLPWLIFFLANSISTSPEFPKRLGNCRRNCRSTRRMPRRTTSWPTRTRVCRNTTRQSDSCSDPSGSMPPLLDPTF